MRAAAGMTTRAVARTPARTRSRLVETLLEEVAAPIVSVDGGVSSSTEPSGVSFAVEFVTGWPGLGKLMYDALKGPVNNL